MLLSSKVEAHTYRRPSKRPCAAACILFSLEPIKKGRLRSEKGAMWTPDLTTLNLPKDTVGGNTPNLMHLNRKSTTLYMLQVYSDPQSVARLPTNIYMNLIGGTG